jgi:hypothetical protein
MDLSASILGSHIVAELVKRQQSTILQIGRDSFGRADLAALACFNFLAADRLSHILNREIKVKDTRELYEHVHPDRLALRGLGAISLAVLGAAFQAKGIGGASPLENWFKKHDIKAVTFATLKHREAAELAKENAERKTRKAARRDTAHAIRKTRFEQRKGSNAASQQ